MLMYNKTLCYVILTNTASLFHRSNLLQAKMNKYRNIHRNYSTNNTATLQWHCHMNNVNIVHCVWSGMTMLSQKT